MSGYPDGLLSAALEYEAGRDVWAAVEVIFTTGQPQVQRMVTEGGVFITLIHIQKRVV